MPQPKIFNDPVYGFITIADPLILQLIDHPYFQRLSRISQVGLSHLVYPGARHTRFHHAIGAMHLMQQAIEVLRTKGVEITDSESQAAQVAILLHDIGHGPFSHTLEQSLLEGYTHEEISLQIMQLLNADCRLQLQEAIAVFKDEHPKAFLHKLVSGQLDVDRLDYLMRDSFYTGVAEGIVGSERIIKMMNVVDGELVIEQKGIYSIEKFLIARRLMYWQVYLHKTVIGAEEILMQILKRAKELAMQDRELFATTALKRFLYRHRQPFADHAEQLATFVALDDYDVFSAIKEWCNHEDIILSDLCKRIIYRRLFKVRLRKEPPEEGWVLMMRKKAAAAFNISLEEAAYFVNEGEVSTVAYDSEKGEIKINMKTGGLLDLFEVSDHLSKENMTRTIKKHFTCYPKELE